MHASRQYPVYMGESVCPDSGLMAGPAEMIVAMPWFADDSDNESDGEGETRTANAWPGLTNEERCLANTILSYFPQHMTVSSAWVRDLVLLRTCRQCGDTYREINNYTLGCRKKTHVKDISPTMHEMDGHRRALWECCLYPVDPRITGCVAADHTDKFTMRRMRPDREIYKAMPQCLWFAIRHDNRSVLTSEKTTGAQTDNDIRLAYKDDPNAHSTGRVATLIVVRFDWRESVRLRTEANERNLARFK